ncbi:MAG: aminotransferase class III-fold pyridoxal phosphate-dependent enzyme [Pseudomonas oryzihabitans]
MTFLVGGISSAGRALPDVQGHAFQVTRSAGAYLWDDRGQRYLDTAMGFGATLLGHAPPPVLEAVAQAQAEGPMPSFAHAREEAAAAALAARCGELSRVIFLNTGSEAVHLACRTARIATGRGRIVKFAAAYDGWYDPVAFGNVQSVTARMTGARPERDGMLLLRYNDFADVERLFAEYDDIAAILMEPVLANAGCLEPAPGYLQHVTDRAHRHGALVILDEVLMGFRLHAGLTGHHLGVDADLAAVGKAIGSGIPVAALLGKPALMDLFERGQVVRAGTYSGNPPACAAVIATLGLLVRQDYPALLARGDALRTRLASIFAAQGLPFSSSGYGNVFTPWDRDQAPTDYAQAEAAADPEWTRALHLALRARGVLMMPVAYGRLYLTFAHTDAVLAELEAAFTDVARTWTVD